MDGRSILPLIKGKTPDWAPDRPLGIELDRTRAKARHSVCTYRGVRAANQVLIRYLTVANAPNSDKCVPDREWERYDLNSDPFELNNLCFAGKGTNCPDGPGEARLTRLVPRIATCTGIAGRDPRPRPAATTATEVAYSQKGRADGASRPWIPEQWRSRARRAARRDWIPA